MIQQCAERRHRTGGNPSGFPRNGQTALESHNQYGRYIRYQLERTNDVFALSALLRRWLCNHLLLLAGTAETGQSVRFVSELMSSEEVPELAVWPNGLPASMIRHHVAQGKALPGSNPSELIRQVRREPMLREVLNDGVWENTWIETDDDGILRLMYEIRWKKKAAAQLRAA